MVHPVKNGGGVKVWEYFAADTVVIYSAFEAHSTNMSSHLVYVSEAIICFSTETENMLPVMECFIRCPGHHPTEKVWGELERKEKQKYKLLELNRDDEVD